MYRLEAAPPWPRREGGRRPRSAAAQRGLPALALVQLLQLLLLLLLLQEQGRLLRRLLLLLQLLLLRRLGGGSRYTVAGGVRARGRVKGHASGAGSVTGSG